MAQTLTIQDFFEMFPDDDACLDHLMRLRFGETLTCPKCGQERRFTRLQKHPAYTCACGHHIHPMVGTPFQDSHTPLRKWFYAMYLFTTSRHGVPAKELQRQLGVSYPTAWRMGHEIRKYMAKVDGDPPLAGHVEADETYVGGRRKGGKSVTFVGGLRVIGQWREIRAPGGQAGRRPATWRGPCAQRGVGAVSGRGQGPAWSHATAKE